MKKTNVNLMALAGVAFLALILALSSLAPMSWRSAMVSLPRLASFAAAARPQSAAPGPVVFLPREAGLRLQTRNDVVLVLGDKYTLSAGQTLDSDLLIIGGTALLEEGSTVNGGIVMMGGTLMVGGEVDDDIYAFGGLVELTEGAVVKGDINLLSSNLLGEDVARIEGKVNRDQAVSVFTSRPVVAGRPGMVADFNPLAGVLWLFLRSVLWAALAVLVLLFAPVHTRRAAQAAIQQPWIAGGMGLLTMLVVPLILVVLAITLICSPLALLGVIGLGAAWAFGWVALGLEAGERLARLLKQDWAPAVSAGIGAFLLTLVGNTIGWVVPCIGWLAPGLVGCLGLGAVLITRFGSQAAEGRAPMAPLFTEESPAEPPAGPPAEPSA